MDDFDSLEPSAADLAEIELEERLITAEIVMLTAEIGLLAAAERGGPTALDWKRLRRANRRVIHAALDLVVPPHVCREARLVETAMSNCRYGCKVFTCTDCGGSHVWHNPTYGCRQTTAGLVAGGLTRRIRTAFDDSTASCAAPKGGAPRESVAYAVRSTAGSTAKDVA